MLVVEDEAIIRDALGPLLQDEGYEVSFSENGRDALDRLYTESLPSLIMLDLWMPVMDGWQFRTLQKEDPRLGTIPVVVISADESARAAAISAEAYLSKPLDPELLLTTVERVLVENQPYSSVRLDELERLTALDRLASNVGSDISNPLTLVTLNLGQALEELRPSIASLGTPLGTTLSEFELAEIRTRLRGVVEMLVESQTGAARIREMVGNLHRLSRLDDGHRIAFDLHEVEPVSTPSRKTTAAANPNAAPRGNLLVIDDERLSGRVIKAAFEREHDVIVVQRASEALGRLELGERFDLVLGPMVMPDSSGPEFHAILVERWPEVAPRLVFMTGSAFAFLERMPSPVLSLPFHFEDLRRLVDELVHPPSGVAVR